MTATNLNLNLNLNLKLQYIAVALALVFPSAGMAAEPPVGQLLFVSGEVKIVDPFGVERVAKKGDRIGPEEHLVTGPGAIGQVKMTDGSLVGVRPGSDLMFDNSKPGDGQSPGERVMYLSRGGVRVVNVENGAKDKRLPVLLQTPSASIGLRNADNESMVVPPRAAGGAPGADPGTYSRMAVGGGVIKTPAGETPLAPSQAAFAATGSNASPTRIAALPEVLVKPVLPAATAPAPSSVNLSAVTTRVSPLPATPTALPPPNSGLPVDRMVYVTGINPRAVVPTTIRPVVPPTVEGAGSIDVTKSSTASLARLPTATLVALPTATLNTLPASTLSTLPLETIKSLSPTVQTSVTPLLTPTQQTTLTTTVAAPVNTTTFVPITTTTPIQTKTFSLIR